MSNMEANGPAQRSTLDTMAACHSTAIPFQVPQRHMTCDSTGPTTVYGPLMTVTGPRWPPNQPAPSRESWHVSRDKLVTLKPDPSDFTTVAPYQLHAQLELSFSLLQWKCGNSGLDSEKTAVSGE